MNTNQAYYLAFYGELLMGCGSSPELAIGEAEKTAKQAGIGLEEPNIVGPVNLYQRNEDMPDDANIVYSGHEFGYLPDGANYAVLVA